MRINLQSFIQEHGQKQAWVSTQQTDMNEARQRVFLGQAWVIDRQTSSNRAKQREIIQVHGNSPGNSPNGKTKG